MQSNLAPHPAHLCVGFGTKSCDIHVMMVIDVPLADFNANFV